MCKQTSDPSWAPAWPSSWPEVPAHLAYRVSGLFCPQLCVANEHVLHFRPQRRIHVTQARTRQVCPPASQHLAVPEVRDHRHLLSRPVPSPLEPQVPHLVCTCEFANVRDLQDHAPVARQSLSDIPLCEVLLSSHTATCTCAWCVRVRASCASLEASIARSCDRSLGTAM